MNVNLCKIFGVKPDQEFYITGDCFYIKDNSKEWWEDEYE